ncbi:hypothetical protein HYDPIDRAFT_104775 [Hydnomerulius pinastri MD-312]|nr:hypothetical protein HYDPIDRAFT_104775 [Hydnomerulius pinastri MD-312]
MLFDIIQQASRVASRTQSLRLRPCLQAASIRFNSSKSSIEGDQNRLGEIIDEEANKQVGSDAQVQWSALGVRRTFSQGLFIRPHYWSHEHRFEQKRIRLSRSKVGPGKREAREHDVLGHFGIDPLWETGNPTLLASFMTDMGKIRPRSQTRLSTKTQRRVGKAIRRAKMMGMIPLLSNPRQMPKKR